MALTNGTHDDFNEFFDFDQLDDDTTTLSSHAQYHAPSDLENGVVAMDWAQSSMDTGSNGAFIENNGHADFLLPPWPHSTKSACQNGLPYAEPNLLNSGLPTLDLCSMTSHIGAQTGPDLAPSMSFTGYEQDLMPEHVMGDPASPLGMSPHETSSGIVVSDVRQTTTRSRPAAPIRQGSVTEWKPASAKRKGPQGRIPLEAKQILEDEFAANPYPCSWELDIIAHQANLDVKKVRNWFNNTRARHKGEDILSEQCSSGGIGCSLKAAKLSKDSLDALDKHADDSLPPPQPPLAVYLAQSYEDEVADISAVQAAADNGSLASTSDYTENWSEPRRGPASVITSVASSEGTAPTTYTTASSSGSCSNISSFGRDRRRGRRRMPWKESPHNNRQMFNGLNSAGQPQKDLPFFCTFCPRAFKTKYEWIRHEDSVHALRTTWICCDTKSSGLENCPFCGQPHPDDAHMAGHKYQQCRSKPESQRSFYRRDHFSQHIHHIHFANSKHPSTRLGCQARLLSAEGQHFGCKELALKWRRFGAPMKKDDPMLHCGFCGKKSRDWLSRCEHIAEHLVARELDRGVWWPERKENHLENLYSASPFESFRCRYCLKIFTDIKDMNSHSHCKVWSCRFLKKFDDVVAENARPICHEFPSVKAHHCFLCGAGYRTPHSEHAQQYHRHRSCNQEFYTTEDAFLQHLQNFHGASALLPGNSIIEQNFLRNKGASFEPVEFNETWQPCLMDLDTTPIGPFGVEKPVPAVATNEKRDSKKPSSVRKKPREASQPTKEAINCQSRQRSETKTDHLGPRFFRLSTYVPILSSRIFYAQNAASKALPRDDQAVVEELPKPHIASLVMSGGLIGLAAVRLPIRPDRKAAGGAVELSFDEAE